MPANGCSAFDLPLRNRYLPYSDARLPVRRTRDLLVGHSCAGL